MQTILFIHGAWHGAWSWSDVADNLACKGYPVLNYDLPGHGDDKTPFRGIRLKTYVDAVSQWLDERPGPVFCVAHSFGGVIASAIASQRPEKIAHLFYVAAFVPTTGGSLLSEAEQSTENHVPPLLTPCPEKNEMRLDVQDIERMHDVFYSQCSRAAVEALLPQLQTEPLIPMNEPVALTPAFFDIPKTYVACTEDKAVNLSNQKRMAAQVHIDNIIMMQACHSPNVSDVPGITALIERSYLGQGK